MENHTHAICAMLDEEPRACCILGKHSSTELHLYHLEKLLESANGGKQGTKLSKTMVLIPNILHQYFSKRKSQVRKGRTQLKIKVSVDEFCTMQVQKK